MLFFQVVVNVGMNVGVMPVVGIPLPFISYGGSSMVTNLVAIAWSNPYWCTTRTCGLKRTWVSMAESRPTYGTGQRPFLSEALPR